MCFVGVTCPPVPPGMYTSYVPENLTLNALESYTYSCIDGFTTDDDLCTVCLSNGSLSIPPPSCSGAGLTAFVIFDKSLANVPKNVEQTEILYYAQSLGVLKYMIQKCTEFLFVLLMQN